MTGEKKEVKKTSVKVGPEHKLSAWELCVYPFPKFYTILLVADSYAR